MTFLTETARKVAQNSVDTSPTAGGVNKTAAHEPQRRTYASGEDRNVRWNVYYGRKAHQRRTYASGEDRNAAAGPCLVGVSWGQRRTYASGEDRNTATMTSCEMPAHAQRRTYASGEDRNSRRTSTCGMTRTQRRTYASGEDRNELFAVGSR